MNHLTYYRPDGVVGVGFEITHSAKKMHSIAWPDRCAERMLDDELARKKIRVDGKPEVVPKAPDTPLHEMLSTPETTDESQEDAEVSEDDKSVSEEPEADEPVSEAQAIRDYLTANPEATNKTVVEALAVDGIEISSSQVTRQRKNLKEDGVL